MNREKAIINFNIIRTDGRRQTVDLEIPLFITANELVIGLNKAYDLGIDTEDIKKCCLKAEYPIALLRGNKLLSEYHVMNGTKITFVEGEK